MDLTVERENVNIIETDGIILDAILMLTESLSTSWHRVFYTCPRCGTVLMDISEHWIGKQIKEHQIQCGREQSLNTDTQSRLIDTMEVNETEMKIPAEIFAGPVGNGQFIKATNIAGLKHGDTVDFTITSDVRVSGEAKLYSCGVVGTFKGTKLEGLYSLNRTALRILGSKLGGETEDGKFVESDVWVGARFTAMALPTRNPQTNAQTSTLSILADSVKSAKTR